MIAYVIPARAMKNGAWVAYATRYAGMVYWCEETAGHHGASSGIAVRKDERRAGQGKVLEWWGTALVLVTLAFAFLCTV